VKGGDSVKTGFTIRPASRRRISKNGLIFCVGAKEDSGNGGGNAGNNNCIG
jgi:hypothetical protein